MGVAQKGYDELLISCSRGTAPADGGFSAFTCFRLYRFKGPNIASFDPLGSVLAPLFNPRTSLERAFLKSSAAR